jgi:hypothetical protein
MRIHSLAVIAFYLITSDDAGIQDVSLHLTYDFDYIHFYEYTLVSVSLLGRLVDETLFNSLASGYY